MSINVLIHENIFEKGTCFSQCHASTVLVIKNQVLSAWFGGTHENHSDVAIWISSRKDGYWTRPIKVADKKDVPCWNPVLFKDNNGKVYLFYKAGESIPKWQTFFITSENGGETWTEPEELVKGDIGGRGPVKNKPVITSNDMWLAPASLQTETEWDAFVDISRDQGKSWQMSNVVPIDRNKLQGRGIIQPTLWESEPGRVHMLLRSTEGCIYRSDSSDGGITFCEAYPTNLPGNNSGIDVVKMNDGKLVLVFNPVNGDKAERTPIVITTSKDNGLEWDDYFILEHQKGEEFSYPAVVTEDNNIFITYTCKRDTIAFWKLCLGK